MSAMTMRIGASHLRIFPSAAGSRAAARLRRTNPVEQMLNEVLEDGGIELVHDLLAIPLGEDEPRVAERAEMARDGRPRRWKLLGDLTGRFRSVAEQVEDLPSGRVGEGTEGIHYLGSYYLLS